MATRTELETDLRRIQQEIIRLQQDLAKLEKDLANSRANPALADLIPSQERNLAKTNEKIAALEQRASSVEAQIAATPDEPPTQSAASDVANSTDGATQNPAPPSTSEGRLTTTEAATLAQNTETGTNAPVKTLAETQSVTPTTSTTYYENDGTASSTEGRPEPAGAAGAGAPSDDGATTANTKQIISATQATQGAFSPRNNVLDQYASYTYNIGWYLMTPEQYTALQKTSKIAVSQYNLLVQSGGAPTSTEGVQPDLTTSGAVAGVSKSAGRNPFFGLDYYFDNLVIKSKITGKGSGLAHNAVDITFSVTETAAITLIDNLAKAVKSVYKDSGSYISAIFALVIRFYGYDENGKIVAASDSDNKSAVVEKIIPFKLKNIQFSVTNRLVEYHVEAQPVPYQAGLGSSLGVVKSSVQISGATVKDLLTKGSAPPEVSPPDGRTATPAPARPSTPAPTPGTVGALPVAKQAAIAAGTDYNLVNDDGMAFGGGGLSG